jgi:uncharacterized protein YecT (DUF1311 family)
MGSVTKELSDNIDISTDCYKKELKSQDMKVNSNFNNLMT